jgi:hypothetical protein
MERNVVSPVICAQLRAQSAAFQCNLPKEKMGVAMPVGFALILPAVFTVDFLKLVYEKEDLLVDHGGKDKEYNFYRYAGVVTEVGDKGTHIKEDKPVNIKSNMP